MDSPQLLVPIRVQALVIDDEVIDRSGAIEIDHKFVANVGRWSPQVYDYKQLKSSLKSPAPPPFYGAQSKYNNRPAEQLVLPPDSPALPRAKDRGVYLHWVLPAGLRHAYTPGKLDFPPLPDHWLIVRFARRSATYKTKAWFVDGSAVVGGNDPANLLLANNNEYVAKRVGKVFAFEEFAGAKAATERTTIDALGNAYTGSPTFTGFIAENRNVFSWHDKLEDLREPNADGRVPQGTTLTYALIGWYHDAKNEPLAAAAAKVVEQRDKENKLTGWLIDPPGWFIEKNSAMTADLLNRRSVFHGIVAHINYWSRTTYKGQMLGYPGAPSVGEVFREAPPSFQVGVGDNAEDALVSLVSGSYSGEQEGSILAKDQPTLWKALEAVIYRQTESLVRSWSSAPRELAVHQHWFGTRDAGKFWFVRPRSDRDPVFPKDPNKTAAQTAVALTAEQSAALDELNRVQTQADDLGRELAALQQDLYARWWIVSAKSHSFRPNLNPDVTEYRKLATAAGELRTKHNQLLERLLGSGNERDVRKTLPEEVAAKLPNEVELKYDAAPRFWTPADPVIVVRNCGLPTKHRSPSQLLCRLPEQIATSGRVVVDNTAADFNAPAGVNEIAAAAQQHLPAAPETLTGLLNEASIVEQAIRDLTERTLPTIKEFTDAKEWHGWTDKLDHDLTWDGDPGAIPFHQIVFGKPGDLKIRPFRLAELWAEQPWSPLFIDWQITWFPTPSGNADQPFGPAWTCGETDFNPVSRESIPQTAYTVRGRSLLTPIDERIFREPINTLRDLLHTKSESSSKDDTAAFPPVVREILSRYEIVWDKTLKELDNAGLMGQALTGFHQALLRRDVMLPRVTPDPARPWVEHATFKSLDGETKPLLDVPEKTGVIGDRLAPPSLAPSTPGPTTIPFSLIRAGALRIDELWLVDDFGQSAGLLGLTAARSKSTGQVFHPRMRWFNDQSVFAMPPRIVQPVRLNFRFTTPKQDPEAEQAQPALRPVCGWIFYNPLDRALVLCDRTGQLLGHLVMVKSQSGTRVSWEAGAGGVAIDEIKNTSLGNFAESLVESAANPRLLQLLQLIDSSLARIRPSAALRDTVLVGRPLALVNASIGLELFGKAWADPTKSVVQESGTGDDGLNKLQVRVNLGYAHSIEDGLVGYFKSGAHNRIVATQLPSTLAASDYVKDPKTDPLRVGFVESQQVTLLMDPWGSVQAACGLVPAKSISLAHAELDKIIAQMEASFRVGPVLVQPDRIALPPPAGEKGK